MSYTVSTTVTGKFESYDLDTLPLINGQTPRTLAQEGKLSSHQLYALLKEHKIPDIQPSDGMQTLLLCWARFLKKQQEETQVLIGIAGEQQKPSPPPIVVGGRS